MQNADDIASSGAGVDPDCTRIGQIRMPEIVSNLCFGGGKRSQLFMTGSTSLYPVFVETTGGTLT